MKKKENFPIKNSYYSAESVLKPSRAIQQAKKRTKKEKRKISHIFHCAM